MSMFVDPNKKWTSFYHLSVRHLFLIIYPIFLFIIFYFSLMGGATGIDWRNFEDKVVKAYKGLYNWYYKYWSYLKEEDSLSLFLRMYDYIVAVLILTLSGFLGYFYYPILDLFNKITYILKIWLSNKYLIIINLPFLIGDFFIFIFMIIKFLLYITINFLKFIYLIIKDGFCEVFGLIYLLFVDEILYNYLIAKVLYVFSNKQHSGGSKFLTFKRFVTMLLRGLSIGAYGVHFQPSLEKSFFGKFFRLIRRGPYMWRHEEPKLSWYRLDNFMRVLFLRFLVVFYFFLPNGEEYRRRSVLWQLLISDLPEDRYLDYSLTPGLRYQIPLYFFIYSNFFAIDVKEYSTILFHIQQEELIKFLWRRKLYFNNLKEKYINSLRVIVNNFYFVGSFFMFVLWYVFLFFYLLVYFCRSIFVIIFSVCQILILGSLSFIVYLLRLILIFQINSILYIYRVSQVGSKLLLSIYDVISGILLFLILFTCIIAPSYFYIVQLLWGVGGVFLAYFYVIWVPLLILAGIFDEWKLVLHELGEWLFVICFHMGGWSILWLRIELNPRFWFLEQQFEINNYGPMAQEYQGFYFVYAGWFMDLLYTIFMAISE